MSAGQAIDLIHQAGGVAVLAHPGLNRTDEVIPKVIEAGLDGIECFHTKHSVAKTRHYLDLAANCRMLVTGGSDCHGASKGRPVIGTVKLPYRYVLELNHKAAQRQANLAPPSPAQHNPP